MIIPGIFSGTFGITGSSPIGGVCGTSGLTGSIGAVGTIGPVGIPGPPGIIDEKIITIFCKKDYGFIKSGQYLKVSTTSTYNKTIFLKSEDGNMTFYLSEEDADEYFVWRSNDLREHKLESIGI
jgi:hypothetical protein